MSDPIYWGPTTPEPSAAPPVKRGYIIALLAAGLLLAILLGLALQGVARASLVMPLLYLAWLADLVFRSVPGWLWWAWFLIVALVIAGRSLRVRPRPEPVERPERRLTAGVIRAWMGRLQSGEQGAYFRWRLARDLAELALQLLAYREGSGVAPRERSQALEQLAAPPEIAAYLQAGLTAPPWQPHDLRSRLARLWRSLPGDASLEVEPATIAQFFERQLESEHDD